MSALPANFDWRRSPGHLSYLACFRNPKEGKFAWELLTNESGGSAIERFLRDGALEICELPERVAHKFKVSELKDVLRQHDEKPSGDKTNLIQAVLAVAAEEMKAATRGLLLYKCTKLGWNAITEFERAKGDAQARAQTESHEQLLAGNARAAFAIFVAFQRSFVWSEYGGRSDKVEVLDFILGSGPAAVGHLELQDLRTLRAAAAMKELWGQTADTVWLPENFVTPINDNARAVRLLLSHAKSRQTLAWFATDWKNVKLTFDKNDIDLCEQCGALDGSVHQIDEVPEIPTEHCTSRNGCVCQIDNADRRDFSDDLVSDDEVFTEDIPIQRLRQLKLMLDEHLIEQAEYDVKKKEILERM
jgi:hypothetical protein